VNSATGVTAERGGERRRQILDALHACVLEQGYARTTLADVARAARMSPSHLLYYFRGKDAILEHYFQTAAERIIKRIESFRDEDPKRQIDLIAALFFADDIITKSEIGFMLECFGVAVNHAVLHLNKSELDQRCKAHLSDLFERTPRGFAADAQDSAEVAYAMLIGLRTAVYFDERLELPEAHRLFRTSMLNIAGYTGSPER
jgi:AcrR family transcriptional regulator